MPHPEQCPKCESRQVHDLPDGGWICYACSHRHYVPIEDRDRRPAAPTERVTSGGVASVLQMLSSLPAAAPDTPVPDGCRGMVYLDENLNYTAIALVPRGEAPTSPGAQHLCKVTQTCIAGDKSVGGHVGTVRTGIVIDGPEWSFRVGARTKDMNEEGTAPEPEWEIVVVAREPLDGPGAYA